MENIAEALKLFLAVTVFAIALSVFFQMTALAKDTADMVFAAIDETTLMNYDADTTDGGNRIVTFQEIIPTIYRYAHENYGVTIIENGDIVARFDLDTESLVSSCFWTDERYVRASESDQHTSDENKQKIIEYINEEIVDNIDGISSISDVNSLDVLIKSIYGTGDVNDPVYTGWTGANTYNNNHIAQRINCDIYGGTTNFSLTNPGVNEMDQRNRDGVHKAVRTGNGLMYYYKDATNSGIPNFTEYIIQIDNTEYTETEDGEETDLIKWGTLRQSKKREIVYVKN